MNAFLENIGIYVMSLIGGYPAYATDIKELKSLIEKLHPSDTNYDLIRIGAEGDGGYLVPDDLDGLEACFSPGVASCSDFETDCANRGMKVFMADKSVDGPATAHSKFSFVKKYIGAISNSDFITMEDWIATSLPNTASDLMLQMDIEGAEYQTFLSTPANVLNRFRIMVVEFHDLPRLWSLPYYSLASVAFEKILVNHVCVHIHPNNCSGSITKRGITIPQIMEFTFLRRDRIQKNAFATSFPHKLDHRNLKGAPDLALPSCWHSKSSDVKMWGS
jgi:hypothetical protein